MWKNVLKCQNETEIPARIFNYATNMNGAIHKMVCFITKNDQSETQIDCD